MADVFLSDLVPDVAPSPVFVRSIPANDAAKAQHAARCHSHPRFQPAWVVKHDAAVRQAAAHNAKSHS